MPFTPTSPRISYRLHGSHGPPVLLLMGLGMRGLVWRPQVEGLRDDHRVVTVDNRGIGDSEPVPGRWTMKDMADDAVRVLDALGWESAHVVGVSMGGMYAQELALAAPDRVRSLALIATHAGGPLRFVPPGEGLRGFLGTNFLPGDRRFGALASLLYPNDFLRMVDRDALVSRMGDQLGTRAEGRIRLQQMYAVARHDTRDRLHRLGAIPTLVVSGGRDALVAPRLQRHLAASIPGAEHVHFDQAGHGLIFQCAHALNRQLRRHFATNEPISPPVRVHA